MRRRLFGAIGWVARAIVGVAAIVLAALKWLVTRRLPSLHRPAWASNDRLAVIATAAFTSAAVTQFTLWMASERLPRTLDEPVVEVSAPVEGPERPVAHELPADRMPLILGRAAAPVSPEPPTAPAPTAAQTPPPLASLPPVLGQDYAEPQDAMLLQDRPVLMDARMPVGTTGSALSRPAPVASVARGRGRPGPAVSRRENPRAPAAARPAAVPSAGLVVITQPEGARVTINGVGWGMTPITIGHLPPGAKRVRVTKPGYQSEERVVGGDPERPDATLRIALREVAEDRHQ